MNAFSCICYLFFKGYFLGPDLACYIENHQKTLSNTGFCDHQVSYLNMNKFDFPLKKVLNNDPQQTVFFEVKIRNLWFCYGKTEVLGCP